MTATASFDVLTERWIPVVFADGEREELGLLDALRRAHEIATIRDPSPIIEFGLYRAVIAFVHDAMVIARTAPRDTTSLRQVLHSRKFEPSIFDQYAKTCGDAFDLFHLERPFLQSTAATGDEKSPLDFFAAIPTGANVTHFHHQAEADHSVSYAEFARLLTVLSPFNVKTKTGQPKTIIGSPPAYALVQGETLFETIVLNLPLANPRFTRADQENAGTVWRTAYSDDAPITHAVALTWPCRKILATSRGEGRVRTVQSTAGESGRREWRDASAASVQRDDKTWHYRLTAGRALWRDAGPLVLLTTVERGAGKNRTVYKRPEVINNAVKVLEMPLLNVTFYAWRTDESKVFEWSRSSLAVPVELASNDGTAHLVDRELIRAEEASSAVRAAVALLAADTFRKAGKKGFDDELARKKTLRNQMAVAESVFWRRMEECFQEGLLKGAAKLTDEDVDDPDKTSDLVQIWRGAIKRHAMAAFEGVADDYDADADALGRMVAAERRLYQRLGDILK